MVEFAPVVPFDKTKSCCIAGVNDGKTSFVRRVGDKDASTEVPWSNAAEEAAAAVNCSTAAAMMPRFPEKSMIISLEMMMLMMMILKLLLDDVGSWQRTRRLQFTDAEDRRQKIIWNQTTPQPKVATINPIDNRYPTDMIWYSLSE